MCSLNYLSLLYLDIHRKGKELIPDRMSHVGIAGSSLVMTVIIATLLSQGRGLFMSCSYMSSSFSTNVLI